MAWRKDRREEGWKEEELERKYGRKELWKGGGDGREEGWKRGKVDGRKYGREG
jgi:hypothetical protein